MSYIYVVAFGDTGRIKVGYSLSTPERRIEAHKRGARAFLAATEFQEWTSPDHAEGRDNERRLIEWCRSQDPDSGLTGEYFNIPFVRAAEFARSLPMTPADRREASNSGSDGKWLAEMSQGWAAHQAIKELLGEEGAYALEFILNPSYALPANFPPEQDDQVEPIDPSLTQLDVMAAIVVMRIQTALASRKIQAREEGRLDLLAPPRWEVSEESRELVRKAVLRCVS